MPRQDVTTRQNRFLHAQKLSEELDRAVREHLQYFDEHGGSKEGICLYVEGATDWPLRVDDLEFSARSKPHTPVEILNVKQTGEALAATILLPDKTLDQLRKKLDDYGNDKSKLPLIDSIESLRLADIESFWIDKTPFPSDRSTTRWWEVWLRKTALKRIRDSQEHLGVRLSQHSLHFEETSIVLIHASIDDLATFQRTFIALQGFRYREDLPHFFDSLSAAEQALWRDDLVERLSTAPESAPAVTILDTGVYRSHSLLVQSLSEDDTQSYDPSWGNHDHSRSGHGTGMAGLALFGDLPSLLGSSSTHHLFHRLESVKILPISGQNPEELYGAITQECVARAEVVAPKRKRVFCLAVTSNDEHGGTPSSWSAAIDKLAMGSDEGGEIEDTRKRLFCISAGNIDPVDRDSYPALNDTSSIENPAQAWNALCVGGITHRVFPDDSDLNNWNIIAPDGGLSPSSRTSVAWSHNNAPIKPEIVLEGGNYAFDGTLSTNHADLSLLTTGKKEPFSYLCDTSAATALAARMAAILHAEYPDYWPETIRGLLVHSARWNNAMLEGKPLSKLDGHTKQNLLRRFGYGEPSLRRARFSASNRACVVIQSALQPFKKTDSSAQYHEMNLHQLPWPEAFLQSMGGLNIVLRVTLSFFIEPNPAERLPSSKYAYPSHRLRFDIQRPLESVETFRKRINKLETPEGAELPTTNRSKSEWALGANTRDNGSVISDLWHGTAANLAMQKHLAVMPRGGWWKYREKRGRFASLARYSLIISLESEDQTIDLYEPIATQINLLAQIESENVITTVVG